jgi:hypothetical protein
MFKQKTCSLAKEIGKKFLEDIWQTIYRRHLNKLHAVRVEFEDCHWLKYKINLKCGVSKLQPDIVNAQIEINKDRLCISICESWNNLRA